MKVILSRKGFDSDYGGYPSPILPNGRMVSLPIPVPDGTRYSELRLGYGTTYYDLMKQLRQTVKYDGRWRELTKKMECHVDPDLYKDIMSRHSNWKPCFGQIRAAQIHLENQNVQENDIFLFFGWFRGTELHGKKLSFHGNDFHAIFGYLQIGEIIKCNESYKEPPWMYHPHLLRRLRKEPKNTIYIARDQLTWNNNIPGAGVFHFEQGLVLTKEGLSRSKWDLPDAFRQVKISYHSDNSWKNGYFQSTGRGQEFVIESNSKIEKWTRDLIEKNTQNQSTRGESA